MGKKLLCFLITLTLLVGAIPLVGAADTVTGTVHGINAGSNLNVRANPSTTAAVSRCDGVNVCVILPPPWVVCPESEELGMRN